MPMALIADKNGPELRALKDAPSADLARNLKYFVGKPVFDETGITGRYDILLDFDTDTALGRTPKPGIDKPSLTTALREQLGLRLEPKTVKLPVYVIESIERPSGN